jgi:hypothetical protein
VVRQDQGGPSKTAEFLQSNHVDAIPQATQYADEPPKTALKQSQHIYRDCSLQPWHCF